MDAKSRDLWENSLPRDMLYQLSVYVLSHQKGSTAAILYPTTASTASRSLIEIREPSSGGTAEYVALRPVHVGRLAELIEAKDEPHERRLLANSPDCRPDPKKQGKNNRPRGLTKRDTAPAEPAPPARATGARKRATSAVAGR